MAGLDTAALKDIFEETKQKTRDEFAAGKLDIFVQKLSAALKPLQDMGIETDMRLISGGTHKAFSERPDIKSAMHGTFHVGAQEYVLGVFTRVGYQECFQMHVFDADADSTKSVNVSALAVYGIEQEDSLKGFQATLVRIAAKQQVIQENDIAASLAESRAKGMRTIRKKQQGNKV